jgi:hypothetical protein
MITSPNCREKTKDWLLDSKVSKLDKILYCHNRANELHRASGDALAKNLCKAKYYIDLAQEFMASRA